MSEDSGTASTRLIHPGLLDIVPDVSAPADPRTVTTALTGFRDVEIGVWDITPGVAEDVEVDEIFLVLAGAGRVAFEDGSSIDLRPGVLVRLVAGDRTVWTIDEPLRKLYLA
ncbi:cupin domain-containing protein [Nonomuraea sp. MCN248]|uniref:Cupin domain-containing protein n=1 Tax=Nonomuraea corallina TaxID=2989783 RepID=A0ABT4SNB8_9ACTN|nr:cupin domain-containing protein [Nonomuraea corallina]MDA0638736.1 cupin domain-containing protein [Nonomuraea corallina]